MNAQKMEERDYTPMKPLDMDISEEVKMYGGFYPERAWLLADYNVWIKNPFYHGPEVPHPDD